VRERPLILLVEDCDDNRDMYAAFLSRKGFEVAEAIDGQQALSQSFTLLPDLVVMDLSLPDMDGVQAIEKLRSDARTTQTPIIVVSGHVRADGDDQSQGWNAFLTKPCPPDELIKQIQKLLS
jgi:CheY-like chemotaxis protein